MRPGAKAATLFASLLLLLTCAVACLWGLADTVEGPSDVPLSSRDDETSPPVSPTAPVGDGRPVAVTRWTLLSVPRRHQEAPLEGATVRLMRRGATVSTGTSQSDGSVSFDGAPREGDVVRIEAEGHAPRSVRAEEVEGGLLRVYAWSRLNGRLRWRGGLPGADVTIDLSVPDDAAGEYPSVDAGDRPGPLAIRTEADGSFDVRLPPGFPFVARIDLGTSDPFVRDITALEPGQKTPLFATLVRRTRLEGVLPFRAASVTARSTEGVVLRRRDLPGTDFAFDEPPAGVYRIVASGWRDGAAQVLVGEGVVEPFRTTDLGQLAQASTRLRVRIEVDDPPPDGGLLLHVGACPADWPDDEALAVASGRSFEAGDEIDVVGLPAGRTVIIGRVETDAFLRRRLPAHLFRHVRTSVEVGADARVVLRFERRGPTSALMVVPGAGTTTTSDALLVIVRRLDGDLRGDVVVARQSYGVGADDVIRVGELESGRYELIATLPGRSSRSVPVEIADSEPVTVRLAGWTSTPSLRGVVTDAQGTPRGGLTVRLASAPNSGHRFGEARTDPDGRFTIVGCPPLESLSLRVSGVQGEFILPVPRDRADELSVRLPW